MALWTSAEAVAATGGEATAEFEAWGVSIDTRTLAPGDLFVALKAERDGHDFVENAFKAGASAALVTHRPEGVAADAPLLIVPDVLEALEALGRAARARTGARVAAITGSVGKTSTKEMLRAALAGQGKVHAAEASYNNHWGVPLTLARMPADTDFAVIEIGMNHPGEIAPLARMARPHVAMVTIVAAAHLEAFRDIDEIAVEKGAICDGLEPGGVAVLNGDLSNSALLCDAARRNGAEIITFGTLAGNDHQLTEIRVTRGMTVAEGRAGEVPVLLKVATEGRHFAVNAIGCLAVATALGADRARSLLGIGTWQPPAGRGTREVLILDKGIEAGSIEMIDDAFNANPASLAASLAVLAGSEPHDGQGRIGKGRRIAILGDMLELGPEEAQMHAAIAADPAMARIDLVHCTGPRMKHLWDALPENKRGTWSETPDPLAARAARLVDAGDVVLIKGSKGSYVSRVVDALRKLGHRSASDESEV